MSDFMIGQPEAPEIRKVNTLHISRSDMENSNYLIEGDCLEVLNSLPDSSVDMVLCDLPYGTTQNKWDSRIDLAKLWKHYNRIVKPNGAIVLTAQGIFRLERLPVTKLR